MSSNKDKENTYDMTLEIHMTKLRGPIYMMCPGVDNYDHCKNEVEFMVDILTQNMSRKTHEEISRERTREKLCAECASHAVEVAAEQISQWDD